MKEFEEKLLQALEDIRLELGIIGDKMADAAGSLEGISDMRDNIDTITEVYLKVTL